MSKRVFFSSIISFSFALTALADPLKSSNLFMTGAGKNNSDMKGGGKQGSISIAVEARPTKKLSIELAMTADTMTVKTATTAKDGTTSVPVEYRTGPLGGTATVKYAF